MPFMKIQKPTCSQEMFVEFPEKCVSFVKKTLNVDPLLKPSKIYSLFQLHFLQCRVNKGRLLLLEIQLKCQIPFIPIFFFGFLKKRKI